MTSSRARASLAAVVLLMASVVGLAACSGGGGDDASSTTTAAPTTVAPVATVPDASASCPTFHGSTTALASTGPTAPAVLIDAVAGARGCLDVVTLIFETRGDGSSPGYVVGYHDASEDPFEDGDTEIDVPGSAHLLVTVAPAASSDPGGGANVDANADGSGDSSGEASGDGNEDAGSGGGTQTYLGNSTLEYGAHHHLVIVRELPDGKDLAGQDTVNWVIGLDSVRPFRVDRAENPPRVMVLIG